MRRNVFIFLTLILIFPILVSEIHACLCDPPLGVYQSLKESEAVFTGKILSTEDKKIGEITERLYKVEILKNFKNIKESKIVISIGDVQEYCIGNFKVGESYLIYTFKVENSIHYVSSCISEPFELAKTQIELIKEVSKGEKSPQIYGAVSLYENDLQTNESHSKLLEGLKITVKSKNRIFQTVTNNRGVFRFNFLPRGRYQILLPTQYTFPSLQHSNFQVLNDGTVCQEEYYCANKLNNTAYFEFLLRRNNNVSGKIIDKEGKAVENVRIKLLPIVIAEKPKFFDWDISTLPNGEFSLVGYKPGKYVLVAEINNPIEKENKTRFFYPQSDSVKDAQVINITSRTNLKLEVKLPDNIISQRTILEILTDKGNSVGGYIEVSLDSLENYKDENNKKFAEKSVNSAGRIEFNTFENVEYWLHVWINDYDFVNGESKTIKRLLKTEKIKIGKENTPRRIIISLPEI